jgi:MATE family multidrug resistance protein
MTIIFISALKGAGDTLFVMVIAGSMSILGLIIPSYLVMVKFQWGIYPGWAVCTVYISMLGIAFFLRYLSGKWKHMRVIEPNLVMFPSSPNPNIPHCAE